MNETRLTKQDNPVGCCGCHLPEVTHFIFIHEKDGYKHTSWDCCDCHNKYYGKCDYLHEEVQIDYYIEVL